MNSETVAENAWRLQTTALCAHAVQMLRHARHAFVTHRFDSLNAAEREGTRLHDEEHALTQQIVHGRADTHLLLEVDQQQLFAPVHLERARDHIELLLQNIRAVIADGIPFTDRARHEVEELVDMAIELLLDLHDLLLTHNRVLQQHVIEAGSALVARADECAAFHELRLIEGVCTPRASSVYLAMLDALKGLEWQVSEIAQKLEHLTPADVEDLSLVIDRDTQANRRRDANRQSVGAVRLHRTPLGWIP